MIFSKIFGHCYLVIPAEWCGIFEAINAWSGCGWAWFSSRTWIRRVAISGQGCICFDLFNQLRTLPSTTFQEKEHNHTCFKFNVRVVFKISHTIFLLFHTQVLQLCRKKLVFFFEISQKLQSNFNKKCSETTLRFTKKMLI